MPSEMVTIVSTGIGVGVFAGVLSGVCYVLAHGFSRKRIANPALQLYCTVCGRRLRPGLLRKIKTCSECAQRVCRTRCSNRDDVTRDWICRNCWSLKRSASLNSSGFLGSVIEYLRNLSLPGDIIFKSSGRIMGKSLGDSKGVSCEEDAEYVREFIETLVSTIVGGSVDDASIFRMYNDKHYIALFGRYHQDLSEAITALSAALQTSMKNASFSEQNPSSAHTNLKLLIEKILSESTHLPRFRRQVNSPATPEEVTYEDLLATAVLNKIIDKKETGSTWSFGSNTTKDEIPPKYTTEDEAWGTKHKKFDTPSVSSVEEYIHSDSSQSSSEFVDRVSLTIHQQIEDVPPSKQRSATNRGSTRSSLINHSSNWRLQRRHFLESTSPLPVPMLVPNPLTSAKVLIGDKEADETSDLSDANSEHENETSMSPNEQVLIDSTLTIEQKIPLRYLSDEEGSFDSGVREDRDDFNDKDSFYFTEQTNISFDNEHEKVASMSSSASNIERDSEYLEHYSSLPNITYTNTSAYSFRQPSISTRDKSTNVSNDVLDSRDDNQELPKDKEKDVPIFEGSYTKKEKEKWKHPVRMPYNPYSEENIRKRINTNERYGRDYYTRQASIPSGRAKPDETFDFVFPEEDTTLYRAEPVSTLSTDYDESQEDAPTIDHSDDVNFPSNNFENFRVLNGDQITVTIKVNEKTAEIPEEGAHISKAMVEDGVNWLDASARILPASQIGITRESVPITKQRVLRTNSEPPKDTPSPGVVSKKSDNTWIRKIYSNPIVRNFALTTRETIPGFPDMLEESSHDKAKKEQLNKIPEFKNFDYNSSASAQMNGNPDQMPSFGKDVPDSPQDFGKEASARHNFSLEFSDSESVEEKNNDVNELRERRLVASRLGQFSKSFPSLSKPNILSFDHRTKHVAEEEPSRVTDETPAKESLDDQSKEVEELASFVSVKDLKKLFEKSDVISYSKDKPVHSLTARSFSKEIRKTRLQ